MVWLDLEMTGLDPERHTILEIAVIVTDSSLRPLAEGICCTIHHPPRALATMDAWSARQHARSGLLERVRASRLSLRAAEQAVLRHIRRYCRKGAAPLCGNSIWVDRTFLIRHMPALNAFMHYRNVDVSSLKELVQRWYPKRLHAPPKAKHHRALDDVRESIAELAYYRAAIFKNAR